MKPDSAFILAQIIGFFGTVCIFTSYQAKTTKKICLIQALAGVFFFLQFMVLGAYTGAVLNLLSLVRSLVYGSGKKWVQHPLCPIIFALLNAAVTAIFWQGWADLLPCCAIIIACFSLVLKNAQAARALSLPASPLWLAYDIYTGAYINIVNEVLVIISILSALIRYRKKKA